MSRARTWLSERAGRPLWRHFVGLCLIAGLLCWTSWITQDAESRAHLAVHLIFPLVLYSGMLALFDRYGAAAVTAGLICLLHTINQKKLEATAEPLLAIDLTQFRQAAVLTSYVDFQLVLAALALLLALAWAVIFRRSAMPLWARAIVAMPLLLAVLIAAGMARSLEGPLKDFLRDARVLEYITWDPSRNLRRNGLLAHLWFTAEGPRAPRRASGMIQFYEAGRAVDHAPPRRTMPLDFYLILCEACWGEEGKLEKSPLNRLLQLGFHPATIYSPVFGGGTADAEFEILTGLPARGLQSWVYLQYTGSMRPRADSLASELRAEGFTTHAIHNYTRTFWARHLIYPKLGFDRLTFIEDMPWAGKGWPDDQVLFDAAAKQVREQASGNRFFFLITVNTHGPFAVDNDGGYGDYQRRLTRSMGQLARFIDDVRAHNRDAGRHALFIVFSDHKPGLLRWFYDHGILDPAMFARVGPTNADFRFVPNPTPAQRKALHGVPVLVASDDAALNAAEFSGEMQNKPFYCATAMIARRLLRAPSAFFRSAYAFCVSDRLDAMLFSRELFGPQYYAPAVYADRLFP